MGRRHSLAALFGAWLVFFAPVIFTTDVPYYRDHLVTNLPLRQYIRERLLQGELPQWYPYEALGVPVIGQIALGTFHPFTFLLLPLASVDAEKWALLLGYLVGLCGAYRLARACGASRIAACVGGASFAFGGYALGVSSILTYATSQATLPWVAWAAIRVTEKTRAKDVALLALLWSCVFLAGDAIGFTLAGALALIAWAARPSRRAAVALVGSGIIATLITGIELLPATQLAADALRTVGDPSPTMGRTWALHPLRAWELILPGFVPDEVRNQLVALHLGGGTALFATTIFAGSVVMVLSGLGLFKRDRVTWAFLALGLIAFWMALGDYGGLLPVLKRVVPFLSRFRYPERYLAFLWVALAVLSARGLDVLTTSPRRAAIAFLALCAPCAGFAGFCATRGLHFEDAQLAAAVNVAWASGLAWSALMLLAAAALSRASLRDARWGFGLPVVVFLELWHGNAHHLPLVDRALFETTPAFVEAIRAREDAPVPLPRIAQETAPFYDSTVTGEGREVWVAGVMHLLKPDASGWFHLNGLSSNLGALQRRHALLLGGRDEKLLEWSSLLNGCFRVTRRSGVRGRAVLLENAPLDLALLEVPCTPRAFLAKSRSVASLAAALEAVPSLPRDGTEVVWEGGPETKAAQGSVRWVTAAPERIELEVTASAGTALVLTDDFIPGWHAFVDDAPATIYPTLITLRGVFVPEGKHAVRFVYATPLLLEGMLATCAGLLLAMVMLGAAPLRRRFAR